MTQSGDLAHDPFLRDVPVVEGFKTLGPCVLYAKLGQGGMGAVYRARHLNLDIDVAVKCLLPNLGQGGSDAQRREAVQRFVREARVAAQLGHENLVRVFDVAQADGVHYLVMEFVDGETLRGRVQRKGPLPVPEAVTITLAAARGLAAAHRKGIIHRDIKPDNVMISREGEVKLADLGLARAADAVDSLATSRGAIMGTPSYMPPEQFVDASQVGPPADVWSLGATLHFLLTGENGISATTPVQAMHQVCNVGFPVLPLAAAGGSATLVELVARCMREDAGERFADAGALAQELVATRLAPELATLLADPEVDPEAGTVLNLVSPPPARTLDRIRSRGEQSERSTRGAQDFDVAYPTDAVGAASEPTIPATRSAEPSVVRTSTGAAEEKRRGALVPILLVAILLLGLGGAWQAGLLGPGGDPAEPGTTDAASVARKDEGVASAAPSRDENEGEEAPISERDAGAEPVADNRGDAGAPNEDASDESTAPEGSDEASEDEAAEEEAAESDRPTPAEERGPGIAERLATARALAEDPATLAEGIAALRTLAAEAPQTVGLGPALAKALRTQAQGFRDAERWADALTAARASLDVSEHPETRRLETAVVETIRRTIEGAVRFEVDAEDGIARTAKLRLRGRIDSPLVESLRLNGKDLPPDLQGLTVAWSAPAAGNHRLPLVARGPGGIEVPIEATVRVDLAEPQVRLTSPAAGTVVSGDVVELVGTVTDDLEVATLRFRDGPGIDFDATGAFRARFDLGAARPGEFEIVVVARDRANREGFATLRLRRPAPQPLQIALVEPSAAQRASGRRPIPVTFELKSGELAREVPVLINGRRASRLNTSPPRYRGDLLGGEQRLKITARTDAGEVLLRDEAVPLLRTPAWGRAAAGVAFDEASGLPRVITDKRSGIVMNLIPAGSYLRGAIAGDAQALADEKPAHRVTISKPFYLGKYEVSNAEYEKFWPRHSPPKIHGVAVDQARNPVVQVNWEEALAFTRAFGLRLPTEAEWEYAARAGATTLYPWGDDPQKGSGWANVAGPSPNRRFWLGLKPVFPFDDGHDVTAPVGSFRANRFGLHDMTGNVWEWCADHHDAAEYGRHGRGVTDPRGPAQGAGRIVRGGSWQNEPAKLRLSARGWLPPQSRHPDLGFRVARDP